MVRINNLMFLLHSNSKSHYLIGQPGQFQVHSDKQLFFSKIWVKDEKTIRLNLKNRLSNQTFLKKVKVLVPPSCPDLKLSFTSISFKAVHSINTVYVFGWWLRGGGGGGNVNVVPNCAFCRCTFTQLDRPWIGFPPLTPSHLRWGHSQNTFTRRGR